MDVNTFGRLCQILSQRGGLITGKSLPIEEQVAIFLGVLAHHDKNRVVKFRFMRSGATVSYYLRRIALMEVVPGIGNDLVIKTALM